MPSVKNREQDVCTPSCKLCLRVWVRFAWKELLAIFFWSCFQVAVGACPRGVLAGSRCFGLRAQPRLPRRLAWALRRSLPGSWGGGDNVQQQTRMFRSSERRRIPGASGAWDGKQPSGNLESSRPQANPAPSWSSCRTDPHSGQRSLASEISTSSADKQPCRSRVLFQKLGKRKLARSSWLRALSLEEGIAQGKEPKALICN